MRRPCCRFLLLVVAVVAGAGPARADDWPQWMGPQRDGVWREKGLVDKFPEGGPKVLWRAPLAAGYSGPAVAGDRVYVMDRERTLDAEGKPRRPTRDGILGNERVLCLNAADGKVLWKHVYDCPYTISYPTGPRTTPLVHGGRVYTLGAMGDLLCLDAAKGKVIWSKNLMKEYKLDAPPAWGWAAHPLLDGDLLYCLVGGENSAVVAFHKDSGKEVWKALTTEEIGYSPPMIYEAGGKRQLIVWLSESIQSLDPATGRVYWKQTYPTDRPPQRPAVNIITVRKLDDLLFVSTYYHGPLMLKLDKDKPGASVLWKGKSNNPARPDGLHMVMGSPVLKGGHVYGVCAAGQLRCLKADTGEQVWETLAATGGKKGDCATAFLVPQGDRFVIFNDQGELILAELTPKGYRQIDRARILAPTQSARGREVVWSHPAFAHRCVFARNDKEIVCVSLASAGAKDDAGAEDLKKMQGNWVVVSMEADGMKIPDDDAQALFRTVKGDQYTVSRYRRVVGKGTIKLDAARKPRAIDALPAARTGKAKPLLGIYEFDGDKLKLCFAPPGAARPTEFSAKEGSGHTLTVWQREKKCGG